MLVHTRSDNITENAAFDTELLNASPSWRTLWCLYGWVSMLFRCTLQGKKAALGFLSFSSSSVRSPVSLSFWDSSVPAMLSLLFGSLGFHEAYLGTVSNYGFLMVLKHLWKWPVKIANKTSFLFYSKKWYQEYANINVRNQASEQSFHLNLNSTVNTYSAQINLLW